MRFAYLAFSCDLVAAQPRQLGALEADEGLVALRARHFEPGAYFGERGLDLPRPSPRRLGSQGAFATPGVAKPSRAPA